MFSDLSNLVYYDNSITATEYAMPFSAGRCKHNTPLHFNLKKIYNTMLISHIFHCFRTSIL